MVRAMVVTADDSRDREPLQPSSSHDPQYLTVCSSSSSRCMPLHKSALLYTQPRATRTMSSPSVHDNRSIIIYILCMSIKKKRVQTTEIVEWHDCEFQRQNEWIDTKSKRQGWIRGRRRRRKETVKWWQEWRWQRRGEEWVRKRKSKEKKKKKTINMKMIWYLYG